MEKYGKWDLVKTEDGKYRLRLFPASGEYDEIFATFLESSLDGIMKKYNQLKTPKKKRFQWIKRKG